MINIVRTNSENSDFISLVQSLDADLAIRDGEEHGFYSQFNKINSIKHVLLAYENGEAIGCGAIKEYSLAKMEVKRMFTHPDHRSKGIASKILRELETWAKELGYEKCILETGKKQPEAIHVYSKSGYKIVENYGQYAGVPNSVCFEKKLLLIFWTVLLSCWGCANEQENKLPQAKESTVVRVDTTTKDPLDTLASFKGKYPTEIKLLSYGPLSGRIKKLVGDYYFEFLRSHWQVEPPIEVENNIFTSSACEAHNCGATNAIIVYDLAAKKLSVGIKENGRARTWSELSEIPKAVRDWEIKP